MLQKYNNGLVLLFLLNLKSSSYHFNFFLFIYLFVFSFSIAKGKNLFVKLKLNLCIRSELLQGNDELILKKRAAKKWQQAHDKTLEETQMEAKSEPKTYMSTIDT